LRQIVKLLQSIRKASENPEGKNTIKGGNALKNQFSVPFPLNQFSVPFLFLSSRQIPVYTIKKSLLKYISKISVVIDFGIKVEI
jgi:hypothetical protein